jgi:DNA-binding CsgD family transcriptional regulator
VGNEIETGVSEYLSARDFGQSFEKGGDVLRRLGYSSLFIMIAMEDDDRSHVRPVAQFGARAPLPEIAAPRGGRTELEKVFVPNEESDLRTVISRAKRIPDLVPFALVVVSEVCDVYGAITVPMPDNGCVGTAIYGRNTLGEGRAQLDHRTVLCGKLMISGMLQRLPHPGTVEPIEMPDSERHVLTGLSHGLRPSEIAGLRRTSVRTVRNQIERARQRLGARSSIHAVSLALRRGLLESHDEVFPALFQDASARRFPSLPARLI